MAKSKNGFVRNYHDACMKIAEKFWNKYFHNIYGINFELAIKESSFFPVGGIASDLWEVEADEWWTIENMVTALEMSATKEQITEWHNGTTYEGRLQNLKNFIAYGWIKPNSTKAELKEYEDRVKKAETIFKECIEDNIKK